MNTHALYSPAMTSLSILLLYLCLIACYIPVACDRHRNSANILTSTPHSVLPRIKRRFAVIWTFYSTTPPHFDLSLATLIGSNKDILDVHIIHGEKFVVPNTTFPNQAYFHRISSTELADRIESKLGIKISYDFNDKGRKIADFKPMFGLLFSDIIKPDLYNYWIYGDSDGLFGSFIDVLEIDILGHYDIISGFPVMNNAIRVLAGTPERATGGFTMLRNSPRMNSLFMRSISWQNVVKNGNTVYAFDEDLRQEKGEENICQVLEISSDIRQCCINKRIPSPLRSNSSIIIAEMSSRLISTRENSVHLTWQRLSGMEVKVQGNIAFQEAYASEMARAIFFHFLDWKYCCGSEIIAAIENFKRSLAEKQISFFDLNCFTFSAKYEKNFTFELC